MSSHKTSPKSFNKTLALAIGSVGTVYGDIGTSPLYAFRESIHAATKHSPLVPEMVLGVLSLILWSLFIIVTLKYVVLLLRADNNGEGGTLSLMALVHGVIRKSRPGLAALVTTLGIIGASLFFGDAIITPAISVLSAVEGLKLIEPQLSHLVIPIAITIIIALFIFQKSGTAKISRFFGPIMIVWFGAMAIGGLLHINDHPGVWRAFNPYHAIYFLTHHGMASIIALGAVFLCVTGAEALYTDLGHFGKKPIRLAWLSFIMPCLILNYLGQGALVLKQPEMAANSFYLLYPSWATLPMVILATLATVIASQAVITGAFSVAHQAVQLSLLPRMKVKYTSRDTIGQIYMSQVNWLLLVFIILFIVVFQSSSALASAYGIAVTGTMVIDCLLAFILIRTLWKWNIFYAVAIIAPLLIIDLAFLSANLLKFLEGAYIPVIISFILCVMMQTWVKCSKILQRESITKDTIESLIKLLNENPPKRVDGTAVYFSSSTKNAPAALIHNLKHNKVLHEHNYLLTIVYSDRPYISDADRLRTRKVGKDFTRVYVTFGYMEQTNIMKALKLLKKKGMEIDVESTSFFISRRHLVPSSRTGAPLWQDHIFIAMASNASDAAEYFKIPKDRVVELGTQVHI
jgi:KUP system potassium uptake protein